MLDFYESETYAMAPANTKRRLADAPAINPLMTASITYESASFPSASGDPPSWHVVFCDPTFPSVSRPPSWHAWPDEGHPREPTSPQTQDPGLCEPRPRWEPQDSRFPREPPSTHHPLLGSSTYPTIQPHSPNSKQTRDRCWPVRVPDPWAYELPEP